MMGDNMECTDLEDNSRENSIDESSCNDEDQYTGQTDEDDNPHGRGTLVFGSGDRFEGKFNHGDKDGKGSFYFIDGSSLQGNFKEDSLSGQGVYTYEDGSRMAGTYVDGELEGPSEEYTSTGERTFKGDYKNGVRSGTCHFWDEFGGHQFGKVNEDGVFSGKDCTYVYPDGETALRGTFKEGELVEAKLAEKTINNVEDNYSFTESNATATTKALTTITSRKANNEESFDALEDVNSGGLDQDHKDEQEGDIVHTEDEKEIMDNPEIPFTPKRTATSIGQDHHRNAANTIAKRKCRPDLLGPHSTLPTSQVPCGLPPLATTPPFTITATCFQPQLTHTSPPINVNNSYNPTTSRPTSPQPGPSRRLSTSTLTPLLTEFTSASPPLSPTLPNTDDLPPFTIDHPMALNISRKLAERFHEKLYHEQQRYFLHRSVMNKDPPHYTRPEINCKTYDKLKPDLRMTWDKAVHTMQFKCTQLLVDHFQGLLNQSDHHITILINIMRDIFKDNELVDEITAEAKRKGFEMLICIGKPKHFKMDKEPRDNY